MYASSFFSNVDFKTSFRVLSSDIFVIPCDFQEWFGGLYFQVNKKKLVVSGNFHNVFLEQNQATRCCPLSFRFFARSWWVEFLFWKRNRTWDYVTLEKKNIYINIDTQLLKSFSSSLKTLETYNALLFNSWIVRHADSTSIFTAALEDSKQLNTNTSMNHASTARGLGPKLMESPSLPPKQLVTWRFIPL